LTESVLSSSFSCPPAMNTSQQDPAKIGLKTSGGRGGIQLKKRGLANVLKDILSEFCTVLPRR